MEMSIVSSFKRFLSRKGKAACCLSVLLLAGAAANAADWPGFMGPNGDGTSSEKGLMRAFPADGPKVLWTLPLGVGFGPASVKNGKVYILDRVGQKQDVLRVLDLATGKQEWEFAYDAPGGLSFDGSRSTPAVSDKYVYTVGPFGHLHCIDLATHQVVWKKNLLADFGGKLPKWGVAQSAVLYKDMVIVGPQSSKVGLAAFDQVTGAEKWQSPALACIKDGTPMRTTMEYSTPRLITLEGVDQFVVITQEEARSVSAADGKLLWNYYHPCKIPAANISPLANGKIFVTGGYNAGSAMIQVAKAGETWTVKEISKVANVGGHVHVGLVHNDYIYMLANTNERNDGMVCFDNNGKIVWQTNRAPHFDKGGSILTADGLIYQVDGATGELFIVEPSPTGFKSLGKTKILDGKTIWSPLALVDGKLLVRDQSKMKCLDIRGK